MKPKSNKTSALKGLLGAGAIAAVFLAFPFELKGAPESEGLLLRHSNFREVVQTIVKNRLNFRSEMPLSEDQKTKIRAILKGNQDEIRLLKEKRVEARRTFLNESKDDPTSAEALVAADEIASTARSRALLLAKIRSEVLPVLTAEQQAYAKTALAEVRSAVDKATEGIK